MKLKNSGPPVDVYSAEERALVLERELVELISSGRFVFQKFSGYFTDRGPSQPAVGCPIGGLAYVAGWRPGEKYGIDGRTKWLQGALTDAGLATDREIAALEQGYEFGKGVGSFVTESLRRPELHYGPFFEAGCRLRDRPDAAPTWGPKSEVAKKHGVTPEVATEVYDELRKWEYP